MRIIQDGASIWGLQPSYRGKNEDHQQLKPYLVTVSERDLVDIDVKARSPQSAVLRVLTQSAMDGPCLEFQDGAEATVLDRHFKKYIFEIISTQPLRIERVG